jgi:hypothetical protein
VLTLPSAMLAHNADPAIRAAWLDDMFLPPDTFDWALNGRQSLAGDAGSVLALEHAGRPQERLRKH